jgi:hypothetical protein
MAGQGIQFPKAVLTVGKKRASKERAPMHKTLHLRHYLQIPVAKHRKAMTKLVLSDHCLALEEMHRGVIPIPCEQCLCHFCYTHTESPEHALLECNDSAPLVALCNSFMSEMEENMPMQSFNGRVPSALEKLKMIIANQQTISKVGRYVHDVLEIYKSHSMYNPLAIASPVL